MDCQRERELLLLTVATHLPSHRHTHSYNGCLGIAALNEVHHFLQVTGPRGTVHHCSLQERRGKGEGESEEGRREREKVVRRGKEGVLERKG